MARPQGHKKNELTQTKQRGVTLSYVGDITDLRQHNTWQKASKRSGNFAGKGITRIHRAFSANTRFPFAVVNRIRNQRPVQAVDESGTEEGNTRENNKQE